VQTTQPRADLRGLSRAGEFVLITGPMFAGKSSALIAAAASHSRALVLKPAFDTRDGNAVIASRDSSRAAARPVAAWPDDAHRHAIIVIDEAQFLVAPHYAGDLLADIEAARSAGVAVVAGGLDTDYLRRPFPLIARLAAQADRHERLLARCHVCGEPAPWTFKKQETGRLLEPGGDELYEARCDLHWHAPEDMP